MFEWKILEKEEIAFIGRLDPSQVEKANLILREVSSSQTINLKDLDYISSAGLSILLANQKRLNALGFGLKLINLNKHIRDIFMFTGLDRTFTIE